MCGIAGALSFDPCVPRRRSRYVDAHARDAGAPRARRRATRGSSPDGRVGLGFRRLAIIDLSDAAMQPMRERGRHRSGSSSTARSTTTRSCARELEQLGGHVFRTDHSDTEVIVHAFEQWGIDCLHRFRGMFAFALWDARAGSSGSCATAIGIKPLYWSRAPRAASSFASEIKALLDRSAAGARGRRGVALPLPLVPHDAGAADALPRHPQARRRHLAARRRATARSASSATGTPGTTRRRSTGVVRGRDRASGCSRSCARRSQLRKVSDVPVGVFLSGGIDSSTNAALFSEGETHAGQDVLDRLRRRLRRRTRTSSSTRGRWRSASAPTTTSGCSRSTTCSTSCREMVRLQDEPIADPVCVPVYYVSKLARDNGVIVCQVGEGADELFWGYPSWRTLLAAAALRRPAGAARAEARRALRRRGSPRAADGRRRDRVPAPRRRGAAGLLGRRRVVHRGAEAARCSRRVFGASSADSRRGTRSRRSATASRRTRWERSHLNWMSYIDLNLRLPELLLMRVDKMSMGVSLEARVPFLDHKLRRARACRSPRRRRRTAAR